MGERSDSEERIVSVSDEPKRKLQTFLYILLRDHLPAGAVEKIIEHLNAAEESAAKVSLDQGVEMNTFVFSNDYVSGYAWELVGKILGDDVDAVTRLERIHTIIDGVEIRCQAIDGRVTPTLGEMTPSEMLEIYNLAKGSRSE